MPERRFRLEDSHVDISYKGVRKPSGDDRFDPGRVIATDDVIVVNLEELRITEVLSRDGIGRRKKSTKKSLKNREGTLSVAINGQASVLSWATDQDGKLKNPHKFRDQLLFFGAHPGLLDLEVRVIETDVKAAKQLGRTRGFLGVASKFGALVPGAALASAGLSFVAALIEFFRKRVDDDLELGFYGSIGDEGDADRVPFREGTYEISRGSADRKRSDGTADEDLAVRFAVHRFGKKPAPGKGKKPPRVAIAIDSLDYQIPEGVNPEQGSKDAQHIPGWTLLFESSFGGGGSKPTKVSFEGKIRNRRVILPDVMALRHKILHTGAWDLGVPFHLSVAMVTNKDADLLKDLIDQSAEVVKVADELDDDSKKRLDKATKAVQSLRSFVLEFLPEKVSLGSLSGFIGRQADVNLPKLANFRAVDARQGWQKIPEIRLESERGNARIGLSIRLLS